MGCTRKSITSRLRVILPLHSALQSWVSPGLPGICKTWTEVSKRPKGDKTTERSDVSSAWSPGWDSRDCTAWRRLRAGLISMDKQLLGDNNEDRPFPVVPSKRTGGKGYKLKYWEFHLKVRKLFLFFPSPYCEGGHTWNRLLREAVASPSKLGGHSPDQLAWAWQWTKQSPEILSSLTHSMITSNQVKQNSWKNYSSRRKYSKAA